MRAEYVEDGFEQAYDLNEKVAELAEKLESAKDLAQAKELLGEFFDLFEKIHGEHLTANVDEIYKEMQHENQLVRLESISKIFSSIARNQPFNLGPHDIKYANAVLPEKEGLRIAFSEGEAEGPVRFVMGFDVKSVIGFDPEDLQVSEIALNDEDPRNQVLRQAFCRHVSGNLKPEKIKTFVMRIPRSIFPVQQMTETEKKMRPQFIFRGGHLKVLSSI